MSTGAVTPFTPCAPTQSATPSNTANSLMTIGTCDAVLVYNSGTVLVFAALRPTSNLAVGGTPITGGVPIPPAQMVLLGVPGGAGGVGGNNMDPIVQVALLALAGGAGVVYMTPGLGTQH